MKEDRALCQQASSGLFLALVLALDLCKEPQGSTCCPTAEREAEIVKHLPEVLGSCESSAILLSSPISPGSPAKVR